LAGPTKVSQDDKIHLLLEITRAISGTLDLDEVLNLLIEALRTAIPYDAAGVFILKEAIPGRPRTIGSHVIAGMALHGFPTRPRDDDPMLRSGLGIIGHVIQTGEQLRVPDVRLDPRYVDGRPGTLSEVAVPVVAGGRIIGALNLERDAVNAYSEADVELLQLISNAAALSIEKAMLHGRLVVRERIESQLEIAREVQRSLLPDSPPRVSGFEIAAIALPNFEVGGDYYDYIPLPGNQLGIVMADVSGKGVPAALTMASFRAALRTQLRHDPDISSGLGAVNAFLVESIGDADFVTAFCATLNLESGALSYANCGHNPPLLLREDGGREELAGNGLVLGFTDGVTFDSHQAQMAPGDILVLYTDGVVENADPAGVEFESQGLELAVRNSWEMSAAGIVDAVIEATQSHSRTSAYEDDFTLMVVRRQRRSS
jgi:phosphoserine phosphatase RsbU/P